MDTLRVLFACFLFVFLNFSEMRANENEDTKSLFNSGLGLGFTFSGLKSFSAHSGVASNGNPQFPETKTGNGQGFTLGIVADYNFSGAQESNISITSRMQYSNTVHTISDMSGDFIPNWGGFMSKTYQNSSFNIQSLNIDLLFKYNIPGTKFGLTVGPQLSNTIYGNHSLIYGLDSDPNNPGQFSLETVPGSLLLSDPSIRQYGYHPRYVDNTRTAIKLYEGEIRNQVKTRLSILIGMQYEISTSWSTLVPYLQYNLGSRVTNDGNWFVNALQLGVDCRFYQ